MTAGIDTEVTTAPGVIEAWKSIRDQVTALVEQQESAGLEVPGGQDVAEAVTSHAAAVESEFSQLVEAAAGTRHQAAAAYREE